MKRNLFISFSSLFHKMMKGEIKPADLENGLFAFSCDRSLVMTDDVETLFAEVSAPAVFCQAVVNDIRKAIRDAEYQGRAVWRDLDYSRSMTWYILGLLLQKNEYAYLIPEPSTHYDYPAVARSIHYSNNLPMNAGNELTVIF